MNKSSSSVLAILAASRIGWVSCLSDNEGSAWTSVDRFYKEVLGSSRRRTMTWEGRVWGKVSAKTPKGRLPKGGDGIAFYHSTRADFPKNDQYGRKPRISLVATLDQVGLEGRNVTHIKFTFGRHLAEALREHPIVRDEDTRGIFERCEIKSGVPAAYYFADRQAWAQILELVGQRVSPGGRPELLKRATTYPHSTPGELLRALDSCLPESPADVDTYETSQRAPGAPRPRRVLAECSHELWVALLP